MGVEVGEKEMAKKSRAKKAGQVVSMAGRKRENIKEYICLHMKKNSSAICWHGLVTKAFDQL